MKKIIVFMAALLVSCPALAVVDYVALDAGTGYLTRAGQLPNPAVHRLGLGVFGFIEADALYSNPMVASDVNGSIGTSLSALQLVVILKPALTDNLRLLARAGASYNLDEVTTATGLYSTLGGMSYRLLDTSLGIGFEYQVTPLLAVRTQYELAGSFKLQNAAAGSQLSTLTAGLVLTF